MTRFGRVLGFHPVRYGFAWIVLEDTRTATDWGIFGRNAGNRRSLNALDKLFRRYAPDALVLEAFENSPRPRVSHVRNLCLRVVSHAHAHELEVRILSRADIGNMLAAKPRATRHEIASITADRLQPLRARLPKERAIWESEHPNMALFNAAAAALAHYGVAADLA